MVQRFLREVTLETPYLYIIPTYGARHANAVDIRKQSDTQLKEDISWTT